MKQRITIKHCHARSVRPISSWLIFTCSGRLISPSLLLHLRSLKSYLGGLGEEPTHTPFELLALLLLLLPLVLTFAKLVVLDAHGERSHQLAAETSNTQGVCKYSD